MDPSQPYFPITHKQDNIQAQVLCVKLADNVDKPMIYAMIGSEADIRKLI